MEAASASLNKKSSESSWFSCIIHHAKRGFGKIILLPPPPPSPFVLMHLNCILVICLDPFPYSLLLKAERHKLRNYFPILFQPTESTLDVECMRKRDKIGNLNF